ncbi:Rrf2 family transcriptional regulator [Aquisediminimonas sediminicola]|uniref:Rrf2 family transcriptional regulator n=1 Tax=Alteraquisediminimonas sediminicola TaxID=2676787 RepID=UPI001C8E19D8|nr:Rrf2 family transcriptional regulator [Aquisediminimonas sediminicola]
MQLTRHTDYALRVLIYLATHPDRLCSIHEVASVYRISQNHLMKVVNHLSHSGLVEALRGRSGGIRLAKLPVEINVGAVVRSTEARLDLLDCDACLISPVCVLQSVLDEAMAAFFRVLDAYTLEDVLKSRGEMLKLFARSLSSAQAEEVFAMDDTPN